MRLMRLMATAPMGPMRPIGLMRRMGRIGLMGLMGLIGLMGLSSCCSSDDEEVVPAVQGTEQGALLTPIRFSGAMAEEQEQAAGVKGNGHRTYGANKANGTYETNGAYGTRAAGTPLSESATQFKVWGYKNMSVEADNYGSTQNVFPGYQVDWHDGSAGTTTSNNSGWEYVMSSPTEQTIKYWDWDAKAYRFFAVTGTAVANQSDLTTNPDKYWANGANETYQISMLVDASDDDNDDDGVDEAGTIEAVKDNMAKTPYYSKLWFSTGVAANYPDKLFGKPVVLEFLKPYARVRFLFIYSYPREAIKLADGYTFKPTSDLTADEEHKVKIVRKGIVTISYPTQGTAKRESMVSATPDATDAKRLAAFTEDYDEDYPDTHYTVSDKGWYIVLPNTTQGSYTLSVNINGEEKTAVVPQQYMQWLPGYQYTYVFKITDDGGVEIDLLQSAFTPWTDVPGSRELHNW